MKKIYICEDHPLFLQSLQQLVSNAAGMQLFGTACAGSEAMGQLPEIEPDVVLLDLNLPQGDGFEVLAFIRKKLPDANVVILTSYNDRVLSEKARKAGAAAYLLKETDGETLLETIMNLEDGKFISNVSSMEDESAFETDREFTSILKLTRTEKKVIRELMGGASVSAISEKFFVSENTVKNHKKNIYRKLQVSTQAELILLCQKHGLLDQ